MSVLKSWILSEYKIILTMLKNAANVCFIVGLKKVQILLGITDATWDQVIKALKNIQLHHLAAQITKIIQTGMSYEGV